MDEHRTVTRRRRGPRADGGEALREAVLAAAREAFGHSGYGATRLRDVAAAAGVDPALIAYYFGSKADLFTAAMAITVRPADLLDQIDPARPAGVGERLVRTFLSVWDDDATRPALRAVLASAATHEDAARSLREFVEQEILGEVTRALGADEPARRAALAASQLIGLGWVRHILHIEPLASAPADEVVAVVGPTLQRYLTGALPPAGRGMRTRED